MSDDAVTPHTLTPAPQALLLSGLAGGLSALLWIALLTVTALCIDGEVPLPMLPVLAAAAATTAVTSVVVGGYYYVLRLIGEHLAYVRDRYRTELVNLREELAELRRVQGKTLTAVTNVKWEAYGEAAKDFGLAHVLPIHQEGHR